MAVIPQYELFENRDMTELKAAFQDLKESHRKQQKCLFGKQGEVEKQMEICRDFMEVFGTSLVELLKRVEKLEEIK